jgi:hypothetical protein
LYPRVEQERGFRVVTVVPWSSEHNAFVAETERTPDALHRALKDVTMRANVKGVTLSR